jgi:hypothetical protein
MKKIRRGNAAPAETFVGSLPELFNIRRRIDLLLETMAADLNELLCFRK